MDQWMDRLLIESQRGFLATSEHRQPHIVPIVFVHTDSSIFSPIDGKRKSRILRQKRLRNIESNPLISFLLDHYSRDWMRLWWLRVDCEASVVKTSIKIENLLRLKYPGYKEIDIGVQSIEMKIKRWQYWNIKGTEAPSHFESIE